MTDSSENEAFWLNHYRVLVVKTLTYLGHKKQMLVFKWTLMRTYNIIYGTDTTV